MVIDMYKMIICLNEEKIQNDNVFNINVLYEKLNTIFSKRGFSLSLENGRHVYSGTDSSSDYPNLGIILNGLKKQEWFVQNISIWLLCNNEDSDTPDDFDEEDLVEYFGFKAA